MWIQNQFRIPTEREFQQAGITAAQFKDIYAEGDRQMQRIQGGGLRVTIARVARQGSGHMDFSDQPYSDRSMAPDIRAGKLRTLAMTRAYLFAFFDGCLKGQWSSLQILVAEAGNAHPDVSARVFGKMWPE